MKAVIKYALEKQKKLVSGLIGIAALLGGLLVPCDSAKYSAYSLAVGAIVATLIGSHAYQHVQTGGESKEH